MEQPLHKLQSKQLVTDYISWRLAKSGHHQWNIINKIDVNRNSKKVLFLTMRQLSFAFEKKYFNDYSSLIDQLNFTTASNCKDIFLTIIIELFQIKTIVLNSFVDDCKYGKSVEENILFEKVESKFSQKNPSKITKSSIATQIECNWGRIVGLFSFAGCLAIKCYENRMVSLVYDIINWLVQLLNEEEYKIVFWIESKGCWVK